ncbi:MAG: ParB/RepB/Spo0J family partition protein [Lacipirellulaceae bacterium]
MSNQRRLGRGLEALLGRTFETPAEEATETSQVEAATAHEAHVEDSVQYSSQTESVGAPVPSVDLTRSDDGQQWLEVNSVNRNPYQPRTTFDEAEIADLCDSIRTHGFLAPIVVRPSEGGYQLIAGERRLRAAQMAGWERVPVQVRHVDDRQMAELAIVENIQRKDLNAIEKGTSFQQYLEKYHCTQEELASRVNVDRSTVANLIRLLELPAAVKTLIEKSEISAGHGRALLPLGDEVEQTNFAKRIVKETLSVRATEQAVSDFIRGEGGDLLSVVDADGKTKTTKLQPGAQQKALEEEFKLALGTKVDLKQNAKGKGKITIHFASAEEFDRLRTLLTGSESASEAA